MEEFLETCSRLAQSTFIVQELLFESGIVKIQRGNLMSMSSDEKSILRQLIVSEQDIPNGDGEAGLSFAERVLKRKKLEERSDCHSYKDTHYLLPTSNGCERLFSRAGNSLNDKITLRIWRLSCSYVLIVISGVYRTLIN